jgi:hypothetical protein
VALRPPALSVTGPVFEVLAAHVRGAGRPVQEDAEAGRLSFPMMGDNGSWSVDAFAREDRSQAVVIATYPLTIPHERITEAALLVARLNDDLVLGSFDLNVQTGEVRFRIGVETGGEPLTDALVEPLFSITHAAMDEHLPALGALTVSPT